ncbi:MAG: TMAO reductase system sensor histidine kinase/response regulator TorS [Spiribacter salinus]|uniref:histidine kinase n=1 Tax=Spiribacter salinus TaxID=1335746 RepID=A0A540VQX1_9GAMM|nr:MAG: TMAO reductase system sensor histidine kinase/response regulator TorS [Spiribacter salinus]
MLGRLGIGTRLFLAFVVVAVLGLTSGLVGWLSLRDVARTQDDVTERAFPAVSTAQSVARVSAHMVSAVPELTGASTPAEHAERSGEIFARVDTLHELLEKLERQPLNVETVDDLRATTDELVDNLRRQDRLVGERLQKTARLESVSRDLVAAATAISGIAADLVANSGVRATAVIANLYDLVDRAEETEPIFNALDRLVETDLYLLYRMFELRLRSAQIALLTNQLERAPTEADSERIQAEVTGHLNVLDRRIESIDDPVRRERARAHFGDLAALDHDGTADSLFSLRREVIEINEAITTLSEENRRLTSALDRSAATLVEEARSFSDAAADAADRATRYGLWAVIAASVAALLIASLIVWLYVERNIARRLKELSNAMLGLAAGDLDVRLKTHGRDELAEMARAVHVFRDDAIRRRRLEGERDEAERELRAHREQLQQLVDQKTAELRNANQRLQVEVGEHARARTQAERANRAKSEFLATVSHEIRTPMSGVLGMLRVLRDSNEPPDTQRQTLQRVESSALTLLSILNGILDYSKVEAGKIEIEECDFDVCELLESLIETLRPTSDEKGLTLTYQCGCGIPGWLRGDSGKIRQVLFNLVGNALKFTDKGEVRVDIELVDEEDQPDTEVSLRFSVSDTGIGVSEDDLSVVFEPFRQARSGADTDVHGTGLGLAIARRMVESMKGEISARSTPGEGSTFTFTIPLRQGQAPIDHGSISDRRQPEIHPLGILLIEDNEVHRIAARTMLERMGHRVIAAGDGEEGVRVAANTDIDLVLLDIHLPGIDGLTAARQIRDLYSERRVPIVAMSAHVFSSEIDSYREAGMDAVIIKPVWPETLDAGLREAFSAEMLAPVIGESGDDLSETWGEYGKETVNWAGLETEIEELGAPVVDRMIRVFVDVRDTRIGQLQAAAGSRDLDAVYRCSHELKSSATCLSLTYLARKSAELEQAARSGDGERSAVLVTIVIAAYRDVCERLTTERLAGDG